MALLAFFIASLTASAAITTVSSQGIVFTVTNPAAGTPGGDLFNSAIGADYTFQTLSSATSFIWQTFRQGAAADRKKVEKVSVFIEDFDMAEKGVAYAVNNEIHVSGRSISPNSADVRRDFAGVLYHEMVHIWQWNGNGGAPGGLIEGIADFVRLKAGYIPSHWVGPGGGDRWDQGYDVTARFLDYLNERRDGFVADLNRKMRDGYSDSFFEELMGKSVGELWGEYKAQYGG